MPPELQISEDGLTRTLALIESEGKLALAMALIDPGANVVIASTELAETLKLRETGTGEMGTAAGPHTASTATVDRVAVLDQEGKRVIHEDKDVAAVISDTPFSAIVPGIFFRDSLQ